MEGLQPGSVGLDMQALMQRRGIIGGGLALVSALLLLGYCARGKQAGSDEPAAPSATLAGVNLGETLPGSPSAPAQSKQALELLDESWPPKPMPPPSARAAVDLPLAEQPNSRMPTAPPVGPAPRGPCGGLIVRLITVGEPSSASIARDINSPAEIKQVGDTVGGFRVSRIEWDRVWFSAGGGSGCSVGIHYGARAAQEGSKGGAVELVDGGTPGLPAPDPIVPPKGVTGGNVPLELAEGIHAEDELKVRVEGFAVRGLKARGKGLLKQIKFGEIQTSDGVRGVQLSGIAEESLLARLGFWEGDTILMIDDQVISSQERLFEWLEAWLLEQPTSTKNYQVQILREFAAGPERVSLELSLER